MAQGIAHRLRMGLYHLRRNLKDVTVFGPTFLLHHAGRWARRPQMQVRLPGGGHATVRPMDSDVDTLRQIFAKREYDLTHIGGGPRVYERYQAILDSGRTPVIVDAGANIGAASIWFQREFPAAAVVSVEPSPANAAILRQNVAELPNVQVVEAAIGAVAGYVSVSSDAEGWAVQTVRGAGETPVVTMGECFAKIPNGTPFLAKIDIEGFESDLFSENLDWIDQIQGLMIEPHDWMLPGQGSSHSLQAAMGSRAFEIFISGENLVYIR